MKKLIVKIVFFFLGRGFKSLYRLDSRVRKDVGSWPEGFVLEINGCHGGPRLALQKQGARLVGYKGEAGKNSVVITFKSIEAAFLLCTAQLGVAQAGAQRRFILLGDVHTSMSAVRCLCLVERYLFPAFLARPLLKSLAPKEVSSLAVYGRVLFGGN